MPMQHAKPACAAATEVACKQPVCDSVEDKAEVEDRNKLRRKNVLVTRSSSPLNDGTCRSVKRRRRLEGRRVEE